MMLAKRSIENLIAHVEAWGGSVAPDGSLGGGDGIPGPLAAELRHRQAAVKVYLRNLALALAEEARVTAAFPGAVVERRTVENGEEVAEALALRGSLHEMADVLPDGDEDD